MKYSFDLIIRDETENKDILRLNGQSVAKNKANCFKAVRRTINGIIKQALERIEKQNSDEETIAEILALIKNNQG